MKSILRRGEHMRGSLEPQPFNVTSEQQGDAAYLRVSGEIDIATAPLLDDQLRAAQSNGYTGVVIDLEHVTFMDVSGLRSLLRAAEQARRSDKRFATVKTPPIVRRVFEITGSTHLLDADALALATERNTA